MSDANGAKTQPGPISGQNYTYLGDLTTMLPKIPADTIVSRTFFGADGVKGIIFGFAEGQELSEHTAARPAILHFLSGEAALLLGEETVAAGPGTWIHMEAQLPHSVKARTPVVMLLLLLP